MNLNMTNMSRVSKAWEDNTGTQNLANCKGPLMTAQTKHILVKYHWTQSMIKLREIEVHSIPTSKQRADLFINDLTRYLFEQVREKVVGW